MRDGNEFQRTLSAIACSALREFSRRDGHQCDPEGPFLALKTKPMEFGPENPHPVVASIRNRGHRQLKTRRHGTLYVAADHIGQFTQYVAHVIVYRVRWFHRQKPAGEPARLPSIALE